MANFFLQNFFVYRFNSDEKIKKKKQNHGNFIIFAIGETTMWDYAF